MIERLIHISESEFTDYRKTIIELRKCKQAMQTLIQSIRLINPVKNKNRTYIYSIQDIQNMQMREKLCCGWKR